MYLCMLNKLRDFRAQSSTQLGQRVCQPGMTARQGHTPVGSHQWSVIRGQSHVPLLAHAIIKAHALEVMC